MWRKTIGFVLFTALFFALTVAVVPQTAAQDTALSAPASLLTRNGILLEANLPLPVYQLQIRPVSGTSTSALGGLFTAVGNQSPLNDQYLGRNRFTLFNEETNTVLEQYGATGGFYAYNPSEAFGETVRGDINLTEAQRLACMFLVQNELMPDNDMVATPDVQYCDYNFNQNPYPVSLIYAATTDSSRQVTSQTVIGAVVQVPLSLRTGIYSQYAQIPVGGPGGHVSLLFRTTTPDDGFSLDDEGIVGLGAVAMPFHGRFPQHIANFPARDPVAIMGQVRSEVEKSYPTATTISMTVPALIYMVGDAAQYQRALEPVLEFEGIEVEVDGEVISLRTISVPAVEGGEGGFGPEVAITGPTAESTFIPGTAVPLTATIAAGLAPYTATWTVDGEVVLTETVATAGEIYATADTLPAISHGGLPAGVVVLLEVEDDMGAVRQDSITLIPAVAPSAYLPAVMNAAPSATADLHPALTSAAVPQAVMATYRFGTHAGSDYPPYGAGGSDLPGVVPDINGFRSGMSGYGWTSTYNWWNASAWERDWRDCSLGGGDCTYGVDRVDFAYYAGHGSSGGLSLPSSVDTHWFPGDKARFQTLRWAGFASCKTLRAQWPTAGQEPIRKWFNAFQGAHMLLGFNSNMADVAFGPRLVDNMRMPTFFGIPLPGSQRTIAEAWVQTAFQMNAGKPAYIYAVGTNGVNPVNNKLPKSGDPAMPRPYPVASYHWVWWDE
jgi:hypothetical protein